MIKVLNHEADFERIISEDRNVLVDFNATWCGPCRMMGREMEALEGDYPDITFLKVDTDEFPEIAQRFGVISIPMMFAFQNGKMVKVRSNGSEDDYLLGALPEEQFADTLHDTFLK